MSDATPQIVLAVIPVVTLNALIDYARVGGKYSEGQLLANLATQEIDVFMRRHQEDQRARDAQLHEQAFQEGAAAERRRHEIQARFEAERADAVNPHGPDGLAAIVENGAQDPAREAPLSRRHRGNGASA